ncbi:MAG: hypothetical protein COU46_00490 [Candidatus Niyogibacteria bacterium CG10_big_fil_rev_8_21_14_0_10_42_19]|uniref:Transcription regulator TrmB N-terminal domain-containing protein n=1 Tax=Candidatus Niyogibacteria bacterium CG10_big_fil_rev_8_21_14_0_10_42_19 TaxID=1974725 RepID=A0A2H0TGG6_9BACT|nr:MAG: hypothetical protein COU46_00490 [Candidatus Niyogibacteria bacterium CG10_big_fil_rev_8_21_14_0_10_42_19]
MLPELKSVLKSINLNDKEIAVYEEILPLGRGTVRKIAEKTGINRGTVHDILEDLVQKKLLISEANGSRRRFIVASPDKIFSILEQEKNKISEAEKKVALVMPQLMSLYVKQGGRPAVQYFDSDKGIKKILEDVLETMQKEGEKEYAVYSSKSVRSYLYKLYPNFTKEKLKRKIKTRVIALGDGGDPKNIKLAERRLINIDAPAYILIYGPKVALLSIAEDKMPFGVLIIDRKIATTQRIVFDELWKRLRINI